MAEIKKELNTVVALRNDTTANWEGSTRQLAPGELALEYREDGTVMIKAGAAGGDKAFKDLEYVGSDVKPAQVFQVELAEGATDDIAAIEAVVGDKPLQVGDTAIVKAGIAGDHSAYTSYVWDGETWAATDGNYSARNVYFHNDITLAGDYTAVGNVTKSKTETKTLAAAGQSLEDVMQSIFTKELNTGLKTENPAASITSFTEYVEIGSSASKSATVSLSGDGKYTYGYATNPTEPATGEVVTGVKNDGSTGVVVDTSKTSPYSVVFNGATQESATATFTLNAPVKTAKAELTATGKVYYTKGGVPVSNLKKAYPDQRIAAAQATSGANAKFRWYVPYFKGFIYGFNNKLDVVDTSKLTKIVGANAFGADINTAPVKPTRDTATGSWMQYWLVVPKSYNWTMTGAKDSNGLTLDVATKDNIKITYGTGDNAVEVEYNVYVISHDAAYNTTGISWS